MKWEKKGNLTFFHFFTLNYKSFFKFFFYNKNLFFWDIWCWCSSKNKQMVGWLKWPSLPIWPPSQLLTVWAAPTCYTSKEHNLIAQKIFEKLIYSLKWKIEKRRISVFTPFHIGVLCTITLGPFKQALERSKWKNNSLFQQ